MRLFRSPPPYAKHGDPIQALPPGLRFEIFRFLWRPRSLAELIQEALADAIENAPEGTPPDVAWSRFRSEFLLGDEYADWILRSEATRAVGMESIRVGDLPVDHILYSHPTQGVVALAATQWFYNPRWMPWTGPLSAVQHARHQEFERHRAEVVARWELRRDALEARRFIRTSPAPPRSWAEHDDLSLFRSNRAGVDVSRPAC